MCHVRKGVCDLTVRQRSKRPVGDLRRLVQRHARDLRRKRGVPDLLTVPGHHRRHLCIKHRQGHAAAHAEERLHVLRRGVEHLQDLLIVHKVEERSEVDVGGEGIDRRRLVLKSHLNQAEPGPVGLFPQELGVYRDVASALKPSTELGEVVGFGY